MARKQKLTPKDSTLPPTRAPTVGRPAEPKITRRDHYVAAALTGLLARGPVNVLDEADIVKEANRWADLLLKEE